MRLWAAYVPAVGGEVAGVVEGEGAVPTAEPDGRLCGVRGAVAPWGLRRGCDDGRRSEGREKGIADASWILDFGEQRWRDVSGARMFLSASRVV